MPGLSSQSANVPNKTTGPSTVLVDCDYKAECKSFPYRRMIMGAARPSPRLTQCEQLWTVELRCHYVFFTVSTTHWGKIVAWWRVGNEPSSAECVHIRLFRSVYVGEGHFQWSFTNLVIDALHFFTEKCSIGFHQWKASNMKQKQQEKSVVNAPSNNLKSKH